MYGITRIDHARSHTHSWHVTIQRRHRVVTKHFSDGRYGGRRKALEAATAFRDQIVATHASFTRQAVCSIKKTNNRSGISGVTRIEYYEVNRGRTHLRLYWVAQWPTQAGRATSRKFSVRVYGERGAFVRARDARRKALAAFKGGHGDEAPMPFLIRPSRRFPVCCPVTYHCGDFEGHGTVWNLSLTGWRFSGNLPLRIGEVCSLTVILPTQETVYVAAGIVRWMRGAEYGVEILMMDDESREDLEQYICQRVEDKLVAFRVRRTARLRNQEVDRDF